ncbi:hypothetical protein [Colwellia sp. MB02u-9]|uniref:hypothetical protein n=1 Tax=Colwellia sp. MB02u-9 TaxID=2759823 RepID=UPI0015F75BEF|nr:hypothetical protein [Colwellia sp. MB02u-9]MBA6295977.1 hypothetical protein [Colwellia sp. MB02u-9]
MSTLKSQVDKLQSQIKLSSNAQENEKIIEANSNILNRLNKSLGELTSNKAKFNVIPLISQLDEQLIPSTEGDESDGFLISESSGLVLGDDIEALLESAKVSLSLFSEKWKELGHEAQQDDSLNNSIVALKSLTKIISGLNDKYWDQWLINLENDFVVEDVVLEQQTSLGKDKVYNEYNKLKAKFYVDKLSKDFNSSLVDSLNHSKEHLIKLRDQMDMSELPEDVVKFLKDLDSNYRVATLELITPDVFAWLTKQDLLSKLKISR